MENQRCSDLNGFNPVALDQCRYRVRVIVPQRIEEHLRGGCHRSLPLCVLDLSKAQSRHESGTSPQVRWILHCPMAQSNSVS